jgi:hypothetical protein
MSGEGVRYAPSNESLRELLGIRISVIAFIGGIKA